MMDATKEMTDDNREDCKQWNKWAARIALDWKKDVAMACIKQSYA